MVGSAAVHRHSGQTARPCVPGDLALPLLLISPSPSGVPKKNAPGEFKLFTVDEIGFQHCAMPWPYRSWFCCCPSDFTESSVPTPACCSLLFLAPPHSARGVPDPRAPGAVASQVVPYLRLETGLSGSGVIYDDGRATRPLGWCYRATTRCPACRVLVFPTSASVGQAEAAHPFRFSTANS